MALLTGLADLAASGRRRATLEAVSAAADAVLEQATAFLFRKARKSRSAHAASGHPRRPRGYFVIAMGKLGAFGLTYSSDIDIIVFYAATAAGLKPDIEPSTFFVRLTREFVRLLQEHTADGYAFRTDLRLGPYPGATQIALSIEAGLTCYESFGQNWERAAADQGAGRRRRCRGGRGVPRQLAPFVGGNISTSRRSPTSMP